MKILFDQGTPVPLRRFLPGHTIDTAYERGWSELANGNLLTRAEQEGYELLMATSSAKKKRPTTSWQPMATSVVSSSNMPASTTAVPCTSSWRHGQSWASGSRHRADASPLSTLRVVLIGTWADVINRANLGMEVMHERNAHNFPLDLASVDAEPVALQAPAING